MANCLGKAHVHKARSIKTQRKPLVKEALVISSRLCPKVLNCILYKLYILNERLVQSKTIGNGVNRTIAYAGHVETSSSQLHSD